VARPAVRVKRSRAHALAFVQPLTGLDHIELQRVSAQSPLEHINRPERIERMLDVKSTQREPCIEDCRLKRQPPKHWGLPRPAVNPNNGVCHVIFVKNVVKGGPSEEIGMFDKL